MKPNKEKEKSKKDTKSENKTSTVYSAIWKLGPRIKWDQRNEEYKRVEIKVTIIKKDGNDVDQINEILNEQFHENTSSLTEYISHNFDSLNWEMKLRLLLYLSEDLKALHNAEYVHRYCKFPSSVLVFNNSFCAIETLLECKALPLSNTDEKGGRPHIPDNIPKSFKNLMERCWNTEPDLRPNIHEVHNALLNLWSSIYYYDKNLTSLNLVCLEYLAADNNKDYSNSKSQEIIPQQAERFRLRIIPILGMSFDESTNEHLLVMQYADSGNLRQFLKNHLEKLNWDDKIKYKLR
ncbi:unnamed protein product [Rhizophagus irregularis]|nr:unnamed protein product [Rhizophagus irregularis]